MRMKNISAQKISISSSLDALQIYEIFTHMRKAER
jgi:hypothetical protein